MKLIERGGLAREALAEAPAAQGVWRNAYRLGLLAMAQEAASAIEEATGRPFSMAAIAIGNAKRRNGCLTALLVVLLSPVIAILILALLVIALVMTVFAFPFVMYWFGREMDDMRAKDQSALAAFSLVGLIAFPIVAGIGAIVMAINHWLKPTLFVVLARGDAGLFHGRVINGFAGPRIVDVVALQDAKISVIEGRARAFKWVLEVEGSAPPLRIYFAPPALARGTPEAVAANLAALLNPAPGFVAIEDPAPPLTDHTTLVAAGSMGLEPLTRRLEDGIANAAPVGEDETPRGPEGKVGTVGDVIEPADRFAHRNANLDRRLARKPWSALGWETLIAIGLLLKAFALSLVFCGIGGAISPFIALGWFLGMVPNLLGAVVCWLLAVVLLALLPIHFLWAFLLACIGRRADYSKGVYGAANWIEERQLFNPTHQNKAVAVQS